MTSEGVFVFLDEALRDAGINPKSGQKFTVKLTGVSDWRLLYSSTRKLQAHDCGA